MYKIAGKNFNIDNLEELPSHLKEIIDTDQASDNKSEMLDGINYYAAVNDISSHDFRVYYVDGAKYTDYNKSNEMIVNNLHKKLVDQKKGFIASRPILLTSEDTDMIDNIYELLGEKWHDLNIDWIQGAANKGQETMQPFITDKGEFDYIIIPEEQVIYVKDQNYKQDIVAAIRYYTIDYVDGVDTKELIRVEVWDSEKVTYYKEEKTDGVGASGTYYKLIIPFTDGIENNPQWHWYTYNTALINEGDKKEFNNDDTIGVDKHGWGRVPFVPLKNNTETRSDLVNYKRYIDAIDIVSSGFLNDLKDIQLAIWVLRGYEGESLADFQLNLQKFKAINLSTDGNASAEPKTVEIPKEARIALLEWIDRKIYEVGQGVNESLITGGSITNVVIKALYSGLKLKSDALITKMRVSLQEFMFFVCEYLNMRDDTSYNYKEIKYVFNTSMIFNENEILQTLKDLGVKISQKTLLAQVPFIENVEKEIEKVEAEHQTELKELGIMNFEGKPE